MKKRLTSLLLMLCVAFSLMIPVSAAEEKSRNVGAELVPIEETLMNNQKFLVDMTVTKKEIEKDVFEFTMIDEKEFVDNGVSKGESRVATIIAFSEEEAVRIEKNIAQAREAGTRVGGTVPGSGWFLGSSLYMECVLSYDMVTISGARYYKMTSIRTKVSTNSGTILKSRSVKFAVMAVTQQDNAYLNESVTNIPSSASLTYSISAPSSWPYVREGAMLGANFSCTAARPSGSAQTYTIGAPVFVN